jgi:hypothetical protein
VQRFPEGHPVEVEADHLPVALGILLQEDQLVPGLARQLGQRLLDRPILEAEGDLLRSQRFPQVRKKYYPLRGQQLGRLFPRPKIRTAELVDERPQGERRHGLTGLMAA